jgi:hypothetical protein
MAGGSGDTILLGPQGNSFLNKCQMVNALFAEQISTEMSASLRRLVGTGSSIDANSHYGVTGAMR